LIKKIIKKYIFYSLLLAGIVCYGNSGINLKFVPEFSLGFPQDSIRYRLYKKADSLYKAKNYTTALKLAFQVIDASEGVIDTELVANTHYLIGSIFYETRDYGNAIVYFQQSVDGFSQIRQNSRFTQESNPNNEPEETFHILNGNLQIGKSYSKLYEKLIDEPEKDSLNSMYRTKALVYYDTIVQSNAISKDISLLKSKAYNNISAIYLRDSAYIKAEEYTRKSLKIKKKLGDQYLLASGYNALSNIYFFKNEYEASKEALSLGLASIKNITGERANEIRAGLLLNMAYSMYKLKDYKAYEYQQDSWDLYEEINDRKNQQKIADIYADRNFDRGLQEGIFQQEIERQIEQRTFLIYGIGSLVVILSLLYGLNYYKLRQKNLVLKFSQAELLQNQSIEKIKSESQTRILNATIDGKETERKQIAETLHDSVSALLSSANLHLQATKPQFNGDVPIEIDKTQKIIVEASQKIRDLSHTLVSSVLLKFGLNYALKDMAEKYSNSQIQIHTNIEGLRRYHQDFEIKVYNITQEFINNILKHSEANNAHIHLREHNHSICIKISDDGIGFDKTAISSKDGLGINQIDARIHIMQGEFHIDSVEGSGTEIQVELPILEKEATSHG
jgi:signal transduction histidine kinase